jgi:hypothetical protein
MAFIETARSRAPVTLRASGRHFTAADLALLQSRLAFPREVFATLVEPLIQGLAERVPSARHRDATMELPVAQPLERSVRFALRALAVRRDRILPPNAPPERVGELAHRWTYAVLVSALLRDEQALASGVPALQYEDLVPDLGRAWIGEDPAVSLALADVLAGRTGKDSPIAAILGEVVATRSGLEARSDTAKRDHHAPDINPRAVAVTESVQAVSPSGALAPPVSQASFSDQPVVGFFDWLSAGVAGGSIEINTRSALVHHVPEGLLLVSPGVFRSFLAWQGVDVNSQEALKRLQRSVLKAGWHLVGADGASVLGYAWTKNSKATTRVHGVVIEQPQRLLDPLPPINSRLVRIAVAGGDEP